MFFLLLLSLAQLASAQTTYPTNFPQNSTQLNCSDNCRSQFDFCINQHTDYAILCACNTHWYNCIHDGNCTLEGDWNNIEFDCQQFHCNCPFLPTTAVTELATFQLPILYIYLVLSYIMIALVLNN